MARDWRLPAAYAYTQDLSRSGWAWEFLRRNPTYQAEVGQLDAEPPLVGAGENDDEPPELERRWGLMFPNTG